MKTLIVRSHPYDKSFNIAMIDTIKNAVRGEVEVINLLEDGFNPTTTTQDLEKWTQDKFSDELSEKYFNMILDADLVVYPYPIWWGSMPAILKGYFDKVLLPGKAYVYGEQGQMIGQLKNIKAVAISTMEAPLHVMQNVFGNCDHNLTCKVTLETCGFEVLKHFQFDRITTASLEERQGYLRQLDEFFANI